MKKIKYFLEYCIDMKTCTDVSWFELIFKFNMFHYAKQYAKSSLYFHKNK